MKVWEFNSSNEVLIESLHEVHLSPHNEDPRKEDVGGTDNETVKVYACASWKWTLHVAMHW